MGMLDGIKKGARTVTDVAQETGVLVLTLVILSIVIGAFIYQVVTAGAINVDSTSSTFIGNLSANWTQIGNTLISAVLAVIGFVIVGVILILVGSYLGKRFGGGKA